MTPNPRIVFHIGGAYHPTEEQAAAIIGWLGDGYDCAVYDGNAAFGALEDADLFVVMGMYWAGMEQPSGGLPYQTPPIGHQIAFEQYVASGRPLLVHHAAIFSYDDWPRFTELLGFRWAWNTTSYAPVDTYQVKIRPTGHPVVAGVKDYIIEDELYMDVAITPGLQTETHAAVQVHDDAPIRGNGHSPTRSIPTVITAEGGRIAGAGRVVYLVNGHDMQAFTCPVMPRLWCNAINWLLS